MSARSATMRKVLPVRRRPDQHRDVARRRRVQLRQTADPCPPRPMGSRVVEQAL